MKNKEGSILKINYEIHALIEDIVKLYFLMDIKCLAAHIVIK